MQLINDQNIVRFILIVDFQILRYFRLWNKVCTQRKMLAWKTHSYRHLLAQFNAMENFSVAEFGNVKRKSVSESILVASTQY